MHHPQGLCQRESDWNKSEKLFAATAFNSSRESKAEEMSNEPSQRGHAVLKGSVLVQIRGTEDLSEPG